MKNVKSLLAIMVAATGVMWSQSCWGQGPSYVFSNLKLGLNAPVFDGDGNRLTGTNYVAMLYGGPAVDSLLPAWGEFVGFTMAPVPFTYMPLGQAGYFDSIVNGVGYVQIGNVACIDIPWLQVRAWDARLGNSYEEVVDLDIGGYGESNFFQKRGGLPYPCAMLPTPAERLLGLQSFALREVIPEPSATLLLLLGLPALLLLCWRRSA